MSDIEAREARLTIESMIEQIYSLLTPAYSFMFRAGSKDGHWHEVRSTALAGICLDFRELGDSPWLHSIRRWLQSNQITEGTAIGSWGQEVWDTAMAIIALMSLGVHSKDDSIQNGLKWMAGLYSANGRANWHDEPWETSWALIAFLKTGLVIPPVDISEALWWLLRLQAPEGVIISPHYTAYFLLIHHNLGKIEVSPADHEAFREGNLRAANYLIQALKQSPPDKLWTGEAWSNGQILWALCESSMFPASDETLLRKTLRWFDSVQEPEGNWSDVEDTASAIIGLHSLLRLLSLMLDGRRHMKELYAELRKRSPTPALYVKRPFIERQKESGGISINLSHGLLTIISFVCGLVVASATLATLVDFVWNHWIR